MHNDFQRQFAQDLLAYTSPTESRRFAVYRNNVYVGLVEALRARYPAVRVAVGDDYFAALARDYAGSNPPDTPLMMHYGEGFPGFIDACPSLADFPWMGDMARVERAITDCYHAPDATALSPSAFADLPAHELTELRFRLHPAVHLVPSGFAVVSLWQMNSSQNTAEVLDESLGQTALICRPHYQVTVKALSTAGGVFMRCLQAGHTLGEAVGQAMAVDPAFDVTPHLQTLIADELVTRLALNQPRRVPYE